MAVGVLLLALPVRVLDLGVFQSWDEKVIWAWCNGFFLALQSHDFAKTATNGYPAVILMWSQTIGVWLKYWFLSLTGHSANLVALLGVDQPFSMLAEKRLVVGITNALLVVGVWWLVDRLFGRRVGVISAVLVALDPFWLTESRLVRVEGMTTGLMTISLLALLVYLKEDNRRFLLLSALFTGLSVVNKVSALALLPYGALLISIRVFTSPPNLPHVQKVQRWIITGLIWGVGTVLTIWIVWPAMWVAPIQAVTTVTKYLFRASSDFSATVGSARSFFNGQALTHAPSSGFYPSVLAFRSTPLVWLGTIACLGSIMFKQQRFSTAPSSGGNQTAHNLWFVGALAGFILFFTIVLDQGFSKIDRYAIPVFPAWDILAGWGLVYLLGKLETFVTRASLRRIVWKAGLFAVLASQLALVLPHHPYYYTYWNPLLGGGRQAQKILLIGSGEGIDLAVNYLNQQPDATHLKLVCGVTHTSFCADAFVGETLRLWSLLDGNWLEADYVLLYIFEMQREGYPAEVVDAIQTRWKLVKTIRLKGVDYVWLYRRPPDWAWSGHTLEGEARLLTTILPDAKFQAGESVALTLLWQNKGLTASDEFFVSLLDQQGYQWARESVPVVAGESNQDIIETQVSLPLPTSMPPGEYRLAMGVYDTARQQLAGQFALDPAHDSVWVERTERIAHGVERAAAYPLRWSPNPPLTLVGFDSPTGRTLLADQENWLAFHWRVEKPISQDYVMRLQLLDSTGMIVSTREEKPVYGQFTTSHWPAGEMVTAPWKLTVPANVAPGIYRLRLSWVDNGSSADKGVLLGDFTLAERAQRKAIPPMQHRTDALWGDFARLLGYDMWIVPGVDGGGQLKLQLYWQSEAAGQTDYHVVVNVLDAAGRVVLSHIGPPDYGHAPTSTWQPGEVVYDTHDLSWQNPQPGHYTLTLGLQHAQTGECLPVRQNNASSDTLLLTTLDLP
jgi:4-amino-4-deoxy-L-arabinose transferase-like glycosyltransferase